MKFIYPQFLWALLLVAIPILIHILNLRKHKTVYFSNVDFLKKVRKETKRKSKIKQLIILGCRILAIIFLVFAFARPYKPAAQSQKQSAGQAVCIYIDNSYSMNAESSEGKALDNAKYKAYTIVSASKPDTKFALLTNEMSQRHNRFFSRQEMLQLITEVEPGYSQLPISKAIQRFRNMMENLLLETNKTIYLLSDFQTVTTDFDNIEPDSLTQFNLIPITINTVSNLAIDSCWFDAPAHHLAQQEELKVRVRSYSEQDYRQLPVKLFINDSLKALTTIDLAAGETTTLTLNYTNQSTGFQNGKVEITDYPIVYDNSMYLSYIVKEQISALSIEPEARQTANSLYLEALFGSDDFVKLDVELASRLQINRLPNYSTIFVNELRSISSGLASELKRFVENGGTLVFVPSERGDIASYNAFLTELQASTITALDTSTIPISNVLYDHILYTNVFKERNQKVELPKIANRFRFNPSTQSNETALMTLADNTPALTLSNHGKGRVFLFAFQISSDKNRFSEHLLFVPTMYNIVLTSSSFQLPYQVLQPGSSITVGFEGAVQIQSPKLVKAETNEEMIPQIRKSEGNSINLFTPQGMTAGWYKLYFDDIHALNIALNYNLSESDMKFYTLEQLQSSLQKAEIRNANIITVQTSEMKAVLEELDNGKQRWKLFILLALLFLIAEAAVIRFWP
jgi:hypothetical protein